MKLLHDDSMTEYTETIDMYALARQKTANMSSEEIIKLVILYIQANSIKFDIKIIATELANFLQVYYNDDEDPVLDIIEGFKEQFIEAAQKYIIDIDNDIQAQIDYINYWKENQHKIPLGTIKGDPLYGYQDCPWDLVDPTPDDVDLEWARTTECLIKI